MVDPTDPLLARASLAVVLADAQGDVVVVVTGGVSGAQPASLGGVVSSRGLRWGSPGSHRTWNRSALASTRILALGDCSLDGPNGDLWERLLACPSCVR